MTMTDFEAILAKPERTRQKKKPKPTPYTWLKSLISWIDFGRRKPDPKRRGKFYCPHQNPKKVVLRAFNSRQFWRLNRMANRDYDHHFNGDETFFFAGGNGHRVLVLIDVDCKRCGTPEGAKAFCDFLAQTSLFKNLYHEPSTNGRGRHGYLIYEHNGASAEDVNFDLLRCLQPYLNRLAAGFDIEFVEVKGTLPVLRWSEMDSGVLLSVTLGQLGKLPRDVSRFEEWQKTTVLRRYDFRDGGPMDEEESPSESKGSVAGRTSSSATTTPQLKVVGSISSNHFGEEDLAGLKVGGVFREMAEQLLARHSLTTTGRQVATVEDVAIVLMIGEWLSKNMFADGSMPVARWKGFWSKLYEAGDIARAWDHKRFAAIRRYLDALGLLAVEDETYRLPVRDASGKVVVRGQAAKWRFSPELMQKLEEGRMSITKEKVVSTTASSSTGEGEASLMGTDFSEMLSAWINSLSRKPDEDVFRPVCVVRLASQWSDPDEITRLTGYYTLLCA